MLLLNRRRFLTGAGVFAASAAGVTSAGAYEAGYQLDLTSYSVTPPAWPANLTLKVAVIADIHACEPWMSAERIAGIVDLANAQKPDIAVLLGDFVCTHRFVTGYVAPGAWAEQFARLEAPLGVHAILGNHDWWSAAIPTNPPDNAQSVRRALAGARIPLLENRAIQLSLDGNPFWLVGLGDQLAHHRGRRTRGDDDLAGSLRQINDSAPVILLAHEPFIFPRVPDRVALTLSGHTHGGQINLPLIGAPFAPEGPHTTKRYVYGVYREGGRHLIVSGGLGTSYAPVRLGVPPEVVMVTVGAGIA
jgi:predicted MPP superfamily phosphohydrolase